MRIQHNIMAMNAYRNYTNNVAAMKSNLEKLSSGYKINRAGDDAAGLAISEKMRAQITGLQTAQKNAKDGISLVQTAEGALTEVHDMLNRMVELATQSANGTYDNETDRAQMQKELDQLKSEINRIADSSNFNGIKLLDGSMDSTSVSGVKYEDMSASEIEKIFTSEENGGNENDVAIGKEVYETEGGAKSSAGFEIDLDGTSVTIEAGGKFTLKVGDNETDLVIDGDTTDAKTYTSSELAKALDNKTLTIQDAEGKDRVFTAKADGKKLIFTTEEKGNFQLNKADTVSWTLAGAPEDNTTPDPIPAEVGGTLTATKNTGLNAKDAEASVYEMVTVSSGLAEGDKITVDGKTYTVVDDDDGNNPGHVKNNEVGLSQVKDKETLAKFIAEKLSANTTLAANFDITSDKDGKVIFEANVPGTAGDASPAGSGPNKPTALTITVTDNANAPKNGVLTAATTITDGGTGKEGEAADAFIKLSGNDNDKLAAAAEKAGAADGAKLTIKSTEANKVALYAGDKKIADADYTSTSTADVEFKDADGNVLLTAKLTNVATGSTGELKDGFDTGLTFTAAKEAGGAGTENQIMALADDDKTAAGPSMDGTLTASVTVGAKEAKAAKIEVAATLQDSSSNAVTFAESDTVTIAAAGDSGNSNANAFSYTFKMGDDGTWAEDSSATPLSGYTASFSEGKLTLTQDSAAATTYADGSFGTITVTSTNSDVSNPTGTVSFENGNAVDAGKTFALSNAKNDAILAAAGDKVGKVTIKASGNNVALYVGDTKISKDATFGTSAAVKFETDDGAELLTADFTSLSAIGDLGTDGIETGLEVKAAVDPNASKIEGTGKNDIVLSGSGDSAVKGTVAAGDGLKAALDGVEGIGDGAIKVAYNSTDDKWTITVGDKSIEAVASNASGVLTLKGKGDGAPALLTITPNDGNTSVTDDNFKAAFATAVDTGLTYKAAVTDKKPVDTDAAGVDMSGDPAFASMTEFKADTDLNDTQVTAIQTALDKQATNGELTIAGNGPDAVKINVSNITAGAKTVGDIAKKLFDAAQTALTNAKSNYEVVGVYSDPECTEANRLAGPGTSESSMALDAGTGFYIKTQTKTTPTPTEPTTPDEEKVYSGTINSGLQNVTDSNNGEAGKVANAKVDFSQANAWQDGAKITIGDTTYTVAKGGDSKFKNAANVIDLTDNIKDEDLARVAAQRLTVAAKDNKIFSVGHDGEGNTTLQQRTEVKDSTEMRDRKEIASYLGVSTANPDSLENAKPGRGLTLQIGDTADSYNKLTVSITDMHSASLGLDNVNIADQDSAAAAIEKIKAAINTVSDVRGTLGATQNRLDHTINNLSVMTENIQDAESTIRDTDVAEEMMAYTKNNILIQSAQAMLAQANQVPQGVLQLLG